MKGPHKILGSLDYSHPEMVESIGGLLGVGKELVLTNDGNNLRPKGTFRITSLRITSWGSIHINLRMVGDGYYRHSTLREYLNRKVSGTYNLKKQRIRFKHAYLVDMVNETSEMFGISQYSIFINRLYF